MPITEIQRVMDYVVAHIESGEWPPDTKLPSDSELRTKFGVSQQTIRTAMDRLGERVVTVPGKGRFVANPTRG